MSRLIDADALMEASKYEFWQDGSAITPIGEYILSKFRNLIRSMPTIEPELIRCKDCAKREYCRTSNTWAVAPNDDWYCADAERRTDG